MKRSPMKRTGRLRARSRTNSRPHADVALRRRYMESVPDGLCELCRLVSADDPHHLAQGSPKVDNWSNLIGLCRGCHDFMHTVPIHSKILCWASKAIKGEFDPAEVSVALRMNVAGWLSQDKVTQRLVLPRDFGVEVLRRWLLAIAEETQG